MALLSISEATDHRYTQPKAAASDKNMPQRSKTENMEAPEKTAKEAKTPSSAATLTAAEQAEGIKKIELEIAAAAGLLRPLSADHPTTKKQSEHDNNNFKHDLGTLLKTVEDLERSEKPHNLDLFE